MASNGIYREEKLQEEIISSSPVEIEADNSERSTNAIGYLSSPPEAFTASANVSSKGRKNSEEI